MYLADLNSPDNLNTTLRLINTPSEKVWGKKERIPIPLTLNPEKVTTDLSSIRTIIDKISLEGKPEEASKEQAYALLHTERDAAAIMLISPLIRKNCLFHEMGCWNGVSSIHNLIYCKSRNKGWPKYYLGTDINPRALGLAKMTFDYFDLPIHSRFVCANATQPFGLFSKYPDAHSIVQLALRVIPVLDLESAKALFSVASNELRHPEGRDSYFVVSYALPKGTYYKELTENVGHVMCSDGKLRYRWFENIGTGESGTVFEGESKQDKNKRVVNTFYSDEDFKDLFDKGEFEVLETVLAHEPKGEARNVSLLKRL